VVVCIFVPSAVSEPVVRIMQKVSNMRVVMCGGKKLCCARGACINL
jgi:hypothetical protein